MHAPEGHGVYRAPFAGLLGAAPSLLWAASALTLVFAPLLVAVSVWLYTLVFGFSALWFAHYGLAALAALRSEAAAGSAMLARPARSARSATMGEVIDLAAPANLAALPPPSSPNHTA